MLVRYRKIDQSFTLRLSDEIDPSTPVGDIFEEGEIVVWLNSVTETTARLGVEAPRAFKVLRTESLEDEETT